MKQEGQVALTPFPRTDLGNTKLRPVLLLRRASVRYDDWLVCMVTSQLGQAEPDLDEFLLPEHPDFRDTGLKVPSVLRLSRLAVLSGEMLSGSIGAVDADRLRAIRGRLARWIASPVD